MHDYMDYCLRRYFRETGWNTHNQYSNLRAPVRAILDFPIPYGLSVHVARSPASLLQSTHMFQPLPNMAGSIGYMYTSRPLSTDPQGIMEFTEAADKLHGLDDVKYSSPPTSGLARKVMQAGSALDAPLTDAVKDRGSTSNWSGQKDTLIYGRMFLPNGQLEALIARRASAHSQYLLSAFSCPNTHGPLQLTAQWIHDRGPWCTEVSYSTDDAMLGIRGLYNFYWPNLSSTSTVTHLFANTETPTDDAFADFSAHDASSKTSKSSSVSDRTTTRRMTHSIRRSTASARTTGVPTSRRTSDTSTTSQTKTSLKSSLENHHGIWSVGSEIYYSAKEKSGNVSAGLRYRATHPFTFEVVNIVNPVMGHTSTAYTAAVSRRLTCSARFDFNLYSYESDLCVGAEWRNGSEGVVKGRLGFRQGLALLFDGRYRNALFSLGLVVDTTRRDALFRSIGLQIQYVS